MLDFGILSGLWHENIVCYRGAVFAHPSCLPVLAMERLQTDLHRYLEGFHTSTDRLTRPSKVAILTDVTSGLIYLHSQGIIHRDLTAKNVLLSHTCKAKISDFGNSRVVEPNSAVQAMTACPGT